MQRKLTLNLTYKNKTTNNNSHTSIRNHGVSPLQIFIYKNYHRIPHARKPPELKGW